MDDIDRSSSTLYFLSDQEALDRIKKEPHRYHPSPSCSPSGCAQTEGNIPHHLCRWARWSFARSGRGRERSALVRWKMKATLSELINVKVIVVGLFLSTGARRTGALGPWLIWGPQTSPSFEKSLKHCLRGHRRTYEMTKKAGCRKSCFHVVTSGDAMSLSRPRNPPLQQRREMRSVIYPHTWLLMRFSSPSSDPGRVIKDGEEEQIKHVTIVIRLRTLQRRSQKPCEITERKVERRANYCYRFYNTRTWALKIKFGGQTLGAMCLFAPGG
ncbi:hypothetical protein QBC34DRAFT_422511 [Podospora aff. communis PSN243]|uniref:Uncharacterized protein n=1 Tax=Podospora aff. communis PSN243 TaxID=3040156 RepID=A0AAV9GVX1_9PEZI|nr:hypothetical protein QBC34DRAFT_422511 [Podospora aff. communis PSN243]